MRSFTSLSVILAIGGLALSAPAPGNDLENRNVDECKAVTVIINILSQYQAPATSFCSSFLSIPVKTVTSATTTSSMSKPTTITSTVTITPRVSITATTTTTRTVIPGKRAIAPDLAERNNIPLPSYLTAFASSAVSCACSCLSIDPSTTTVKTTSIVVAPGSTIVVTSTVTANPVTTTVSTATITASKISSTQSTVARSSQTSSPTTMSSVKPSTASTASSAAQSLTVSSSSRASSTVPSAQSSAVSSSSTSVQTSAVPSTTSVSSVVSSTTQGSTISSSSISLQTSAMSTATSVSSLVSSTAQSSIIPPSFTSAQTSSVYSATGTSLQVSSTAQSSAVSSNPSSIQTSAPSSTLPPCDNPMPTFILQLDSPVPLNGANLQGTYAEIGSNISELSFNGLSDASAATVLDLDFNRFLHVPQTDFSAVRLAGEQGTLQPVSFDTAFPGVYECSVATGFLTCTDGVDSDFQLCPGQSTSEDNALYIGPGPGEGCYPAVLGVIPLCDPPPADGDDL